MGLFKGGKVVWVGIYFIFGNIETFLKQLNIIDPTAMLPLTLYGLAWLLLCSFLINWLFVGQPVKICRLQDVTIA